MPRILRIANRFNLGGPTYNVAYLTKYLEPEYKTLLVGGQKDESEDTSEFILDQLDIKPVIIPEMKREINLINDYKAYRRLKQIILEFKPDIVHTHASKAGALGRFAAYNCNVPIILHTFHGHVFHSYFGILKTKFYKVVERYLANLSTKVIAISNKQREELISEHQIADSEKVTIVRLGFELERFRENKKIKRQVFRQKYDLKDDTIAIGIIGRLVPIKNHQLFVEAIRYIMDNTDRKIKAFIIGDGESKDTILKIIYELKLSCSFINDSGGDIIMTSWIRDVENVYPGLDIVALSSLNEGTPVSLIEAQAAGVPIVTTKVGGIQDVVEENKSALLSDSNDEMKFKENLLELVTNDEKRLNMQEVGEAFAFNNYDYKILVSKMGKLYKKLLPH